VDEQRRVWPHGARANVGRDQYPPKPDAGSNAPFSYSCEGGRHGAVSGCEGGHERNGLERESNSYAVPCGLRLDQPTQRVHNKVCKKPVLGLLAVGFGHFDTILARKKRKFWVWPFFLVLAPVLGWRRAAVGSSISYGTLGMCWREGRRPDRRRHRRPSRPRSRPRHVETSSAPSTRSSTACPARLRTYGSAAARSGCR